MERNQQGIQAQHEEFPGPSTHQGQAICGVSVPKEGISHWNDHRSSLWTRCSERERGMHKSFHHASPTCLKSFPAAPASSLFSELPPSFPALWTLPSLFSGLLVGIHNGFLTVGCIRGLWFLESNPVSGSSSQNSRSSALSKMQPSALANSPSLCGEFWVSASRHCRGGPLLWGHNYYFQENCVPPKPRVLTCTGLESMLLSFSSMSFEQLLENSHASPSSFNYPKET